MQQDGNIYPLNDKKKLDTSTRIVVRAKRKTLIIGWNHESLRLFDKIKGYPALNYDIKDFISVKKLSRKAKYRDVQLLGDISSIKTWVALLNIEEILIAIEPEYRDRLDEIIKICQDTGIHYRIISDVFDTVYGNVVKDIYASLFQKGEFGLHRIIDGIGSIILLFTLLPVFLAIVVAIKLDSVGAVFYSKIRVGKGGKPFRIFRFRSMVQDAEKKSGPTWAQKRDPRITRIGRFMRLISIDELPQLMNILKGDMSFIGPQPERPFFVDTFKEQIPLYEHRLKVKPGVTGLAQVKWPYDENIEDVKEKIKFDLQYIEKRNIWLDIKIYFLTIITVLTQQGQ
jgi:exopolysaccharide biosynthesis polyprenyl glycosylphosphotransferase